MLEIKNLSYRYKSREQFTLKKINLSLEDKGMLLLAGRSGCGKSTLIKAVSGLLNDGENGELLGDILLDGKKLTELPPEKIGVMVGTVYQTPDDQLFAMTAADEVGFVLENQGEDPEIIRRKVSETLTLVGLKGFEECSIHRLSGGQRQRLALASVLVTRPRLLILDEPVSQMNPQGVKAFMELLKRLNGEAGIAILMIEHRVNELAPYFSRLAVMSEGEIVYDGLMEEAWAALSGREDLGLREPQTVKLCRALKLSRLTADGLLTAEMIKKECVIKNSPAGKEGEKEGSEVLKAEGITYTYPGAKAATLLGLDFSLEKGRITALMGSNGAGKSTLMNLLGGLTKVTGGKLLLDGRPIKDALGEIGYLRQEPDLMLLADTVMEELCWKNKGFTEEAAAELLKKLQLTEYAADFPLALSKGQRLRVVLGAMLARKPKLLLLDEPTTGQDEQSLTEIKRLLLDFKGQGGCVFICTHDTELAAAVAERVILLKEGRIVADGESRSILTDRKLLKEGGLLVPQLVDICGKIGIPPCVSAEEVTGFVCTAAVGRN